MDRKEAKATTIELLTQVGIPSPPSGEGYPGQLSRHAPARRHGDSLACAPVCSWPTSDTPSTAVSRPRGVENEVRRSSTTRNGGASAAASGNSRPRRGAGSQLDLGHVEVLAEAVADQVQGEQEREHGEGGNSASHGFTFRYVRLSFNMLPHDGVGPVWRARGRRAIPPAPRWWPRRSGRRRR